MIHSSKFLDLFAAAQRCWHERKEDRFLLSLAIPIHGIDPIHKLPIIQGEERFGFLWDRHPGLCIAAAGISEEYETHGPARFDLSESFSEKIFENLIDLTPEAPVHASAKILFSFSFFDELSDKIALTSIKSTARVVLPKWQISSLDCSVWLRLSSYISSECDVKKSVENLFDMSEKLSPSTENKNLQKEKIIVKSKIIDWKDTCLDVLKRGIELVKIGELDKLVVAVKQSISLKKSFQPLSMLHKLRFQQASSCRFLWQTSEESTFFGASPERLLTINSGQIRSDALAGTARKKEREINLLQSEKNLREHDLVVASITNKFFELGLTPVTPKGPQIVDQGNILHLHTPIFAVSNEKSPLQLLRSLHPTPAVAGLPQAKALEWLRKLEPFERGNYAAPIGWIDNYRNAEFRVAIRCGDARFDKLDLYAGAGLVIGSDINEELREIELKLAVLEDQLDLLP